ncbi:hypothetical protein PHYPO_G00194420 [Pangasianodon hypophthalmus]|uniref:Myb/SANT-like DNA-binding domain-containing protein n=1 Tax=Pangasianodon hypophthalmus TaxID=310915 RepID=A0A5N5PIF2_PANHP|nr:uncharacterized protein LOC113540166 [Pangasianodon hypophthalmus]XP_053089594.1 uncharacterized protein LOC113540166 [Pangasianodon hypophthalmus]XP_053089595.1 uncharacterized protein LOC113540166 [Pangasianodon hypophthalmus]KAB5579382.1 hypothetical protein PHYPO_G00194420 [Pangasianodon hypophthalmus]
MTLFVDTQRSIPLTEQLQQAARETTACYIDDTMTERVTVYVAENNLEAETSPSAEPLPPNESFNKEQTRFLIDLIRNQLEADGRGLPRTFKELNYRLKSAKGQKKNLWMDMANKLSKHFMETFDPSKVARKWYTLEDGYKKVLEHNSTSSQIKTRFQFFTEMEELLDGHHDIDFPAVGTVQGVVGRRRKALSIDCQRDSSAARQTSTRPASPTQPLRKRRRTEEDYSTLLDFLRESEAASQRRHEEILAQMKSAQKGFEELMRKFLEKM